MGTHFVKELCDIPFIGESGFNPDSFITIWSSYALWHNPNVVMRTNTANGEVNIFFKPLNLTIEFKWVNRVLVCLDGSYFFRAVRQWVTEHDASDPVHAAQLVPTLIERASPGTAFDEPEPEYGASAAMLTRGADGVKRQRPERYREENEPTTIVQVQENAQALDSQAMEGLATGTMLDDTESEPPNLLDYESDTDSECSTTQEELYKRERELDEQMLDSLHVVDGEKLTSEDLEVLDQGEPVRLQSPFPDGAILATKNAIGTALAIKEWQRRLGYKSLEKIADSYITGSVDFPSSLKVNRKQIVNADVILGTSNPGGKQGRYIHQRNVPPAAERRVDIANGEMVMQSDLIFDDGLVFLLSVFDPTSYSLISWLRSEKSADILPRLREHVQFPERFGRTVKIVMTDPGPSFKALKADIEALPSKPSYYPLSREQHPVLVDNVVQDIKAPVRAARATLLFPCGGLILIGIYMMACVLHNTLASLHNIGNVSPHLALTGERTKLEHIARHAAGDICLAPRSEQPGNITSEAKSVYMIALHANFAHLNTPQWTYLTLDNFVPVQRSAATNVPTTEDVVEYIKAAACDPTSPIYCPSYAKKNGLTDKSKRGKTRKRSGRGRPRKNGDDGDAPDHPIDLNEEMQRNIILDDGTGFATPPHTGAPARTPRSRLRSASSRLPQIQLNALPNIDVIPRIMADEFETESQALAQPDMIQVHANGSVSYSAFEGGAFRRKPLVYAEYTGTTRYENIEANYMFAGHMSLRKALAEYPDEARQALIDKN